MMVFSRGRVALLLTLLSATATQAQVGRNNWGSVTAPVYNRRDTGAFSAAELLAGPGKFGSYYSGVLPNGRIVTPAGISAQVGMNPLGIVLTPDGKYLITSNDDERNANTVSLQNPTNKGGYSLTIMDTATMKVIGQTNTTGRYFIGLQVKGNAPYTLYASGGADNDVKVYTITIAGGAATFSKPVSIPITPILPADQGYVSHYVPDALLNTPDAKGNLPIVPSAFDREKGAAITFPAGSVLSRKGEYLYVACNGDNSVAIIETTSNTVINRVRVGFFPYTVALSSNNRLLVSNWGISEYKFARPNYSGGKLTALSATPGNLPAGFFVPKGDSKLRGSSIMTFILPEDIPNNSPDNKLRPESVFNLGITPLDPLNQVGGTHPSAMGIVHNPKGDVLYVTKTNDDSVGLIRLSDLPKFNPLPDFDLSPLSVKVGGLRVHGSYPNAIVVAPDNKRVYVAEAGLNSVAVLDTTVPTRPRLVGRISTGWYPTGLAVSADNRFLYVVNAKGIGEDIHPQTLAKITSSQAATGIESFADSNFIFGSVQKIDLSRLKPENTTVLSHNYTIHPPTDTRVVPVGGVASRKIKHVFLILHENKTFDMMLGNQSRFGVFASTHYFDAMGNPVDDSQQTGVALNTQLFANTFATAVNYYSDAEESDAGHQYASSGTASDYTEKTLLVKDGRGLLVNKNFEPEDYPEHGYIYNNMARNGVSFKVYGDMIRIEGTDTGTSKPTTVNDPRSGRVGYPKLASPGNVTKPLVNAGDTGGGTHDPMDATPQTTGTSPGLGQSYFMNQPILQVLGTKNPAKGGKPGEPRLDQNYPGYNFNISDQRRAQEFIKDFDRMVASGTLPTYLHIYQPNDHGGGVQAPNSKEVGTVFSQQVADGDTALGMVVRHIMNSPVYYDAKSDTGSAIFITYDDAQSSRDHIHPHRTPLIVVSPFAKPKYIATRHYSTASILKTEELLMGLPPNNYGDLFATDLRDLFQPQYNGIKAAQLGVTRVAHYIPSPEGKRIWSLTNQLDLSAPDRDSRRLGALARLSARADHLYRAAIRQKQTGSTTYRAAQQHLYQLAESVVAGGNIGDGDD